MKVLNLYAGIGGNRKLWENVEVTAVESEQYIADAYHKLFPQDTMVVGDAHQYLLDHHKEFDFIWSSPPCPSHSRMNTSQYPRGIIRYPDLGLYQEIILLKQWHLGKWIVENVEPYYFPLMQPRLVINRHCIWSNFNIPHFKLENRGFDLAMSEYDELSAHFGMDLESMGLKRKPARIAMRNICDPKIGLHILKAAQKEVTQGVLL